MRRLQIQMFSNIQIIASARIVRQVPSGYVREPVKRIRPYILIPHQRIM